MLFSLSNVKNKDLEMGLIISLSHIHLKYVAKKTKKTIHVKRKWYEEQNLSLAFQKKYQ